MSWILDRLIEEGGILTGRAGSGRETCPEACSRGPPVRKARVWGWVG